MFSSRKRKTNLEFGIIPTGILTPMFFCLLQLGFYNKECSKKPTLKAAFDVIVDFHHLQILLKLKEYKEPLKIFESMQGHAPAARALKKQLTGSGRVFVLVEDKLQR